jgi:O-antigen ligase
MKGRLLLFLFSLGLIFLLSLVVLVQRSPDLFTNTTYLGAALAFEIALVSLSRFEEAFFPLMIGTFLWAGSSVPYWSVGNSLRWFFLAVGAVAGFIIWIKRPQTRHFGAFHLVAFLCVLSALVSTLVSEVPKIALLKVASLFLLFLYTSAGARVAAIGREDKFLGSLVLVCEVLVYLSAICYFIFGFKFFGNPNALGAFVGVVAVPLLLWGAIVAESRGRRQRRFAALAICGLLLYAANSRASILSAVAVILFVTIALHRQRLLLQFAFVSVFFIAAMAVINPFHLDELASTLTGRVVYKEQGKYKGVFGSRLSPWSETLAVVKRHPWFGSGFGTSELGGLRRDNASSSVYTTEGTNREHGNSYLALAEYMGILGAVPFVVLLLMLLLVLARIYVWMRRTRNPYHYAIPFALVALAGLVHAFFEDWLFAVGSYLCVFFWVSAFLLVDLVPVVGRGSSTNVFTARSSALTTPAAVIGSFADQSAISNR